MLCWRTSASIFLTPCQICIPNERLQKYPGAEFSGKPLSTSLDFRRNVFTRFPHPIASYFNGGRTNVFFKASVVREVSEAENVQRRIKRVEDRNIVSKQVLLSHFKCRTSILRNAGDACESSKNPKLILF